MSDPRPEWDDERLGAAFATRAARTPEAPIDLVDEIRRAIDRVPTRSTARHGMLAVAAVVALAIGVAALAIVGRPLAQHSGPGPTTAVHAALGEPISVPEAIALRDASASDREIVVAGFQSATPPVPCPAPVGPANPTLLRCPESLAWLMARPELLWTTSGSSTSGGPPNGPAFHASYATVERGFADDPAKPVAVVVVGHFHDRRAALCEPASVVECGKTFIVDGVTFVNGGPRSITTLRRNERWDEATQTTVRIPPSDLEEDVDRLVLAQVLDGSILSRQLVTIDQVTGVEPVLANDDVVPHIGNPDTLIWIVIVLGLRDGVPTVRTFALMDGSNWFAEVTSKGAVMLERRASGGPSAPPPAIASADPTAFDSAPTSVLGIKVRDIATVMRDRRADFGDLGRDEFSIRAWYVGPNPSASCEPASPQIHPPTPPCDAARHWLVDRPEQLGAEVGQLRTNPEHWPPVLNPLLPVDVPFDVPATWSDDVPVPAPVIVLGHFEDMRVDTYAANLYFVIDALAWTRERPTRGLDSVTRLSSSGTEDPASVLARIDGIAGTTAVATWATVVDAPDFAALDPRAAENMPEFTSGRPVWVVRRLIESEMDGRQRLAVEWAFTADGGQRAWITPSPDSEPDLATTMNLHDLDPRTRIVRVFDYDQLVRSVRSAHSGESFAWRPTWPDRAGSLEVARGRTNWEIAIRWRSGSCDPEWSVLVNRLVDPPGVYIQPQTFGDYCPDEKHRRIIVIEFDQPVGLDQVKSSDPNGSGG